MGEDLDLCWRAQVAGARVVVAPDARVRHLEVIAPGVQPVLDGRRRRRHAAGAAATPRAADRPQVLQHLPPAPGPPAGRRPHHRRGAGRPDRPRPGPGPGGRQRVAMELRPPGGAASAAPGGPAVPPGVGQPDPAQPDPGERPALRVPVEREPPRLRGHPRTRRRARSADEEIAEPELTGSIAGAFSEDDSFDDWDDRGRFAPRGPRRSRVLASRRSRLVAGLAVALLLVIGVRDLMSGAFPAVGQFLAPLSWSANLAPVLRELAAGRGGHDRAVVSRLRRARRARHDPARRDGARPEGARARLRPGRRMGSVAAPGPVRLEARAARRRRGATSASRSSTTPSRTAGSTAMVTFALAPWVIAALMRAIRRRPLRRRAGPPRSPAAEPRCSASGSCSRSGSPSPRPWRWSSSCAPSGSGPGRGWSARPGGPAGCVRAAIGGTRRRARCSARPG